MARQPIIGTYGKFRPTGVDTSGVEVLQRMAGLTSQAQDIAFGIGAERAQKEGRLEGLQSVQQEGGQTKPPELREEGLSIRNKAFNQASILAHRAAIKTDTKNRLDQLERDESLDPEKFELRARAYKEGLLSEMPEELAVLVGQDLDASIVSRKSSLDDAYFKRIERENQAALSDGLESATDDILNAVRKGDVALVESLSVQNEAMLNQAVESGLLDPVKANDIREQIRERSAEQKTLGEVDRIIFDENLSLEQRLQKGVTFLESLREKELKDLSPEQKDSLMNVVGGKVMDLQRQLVAKNAERNIEVEREVSDLKVAAKNGFDSTQNLIERTEKAHREGKISGNERTSLLNDVYSGNRKAIKKQQDFSLVTKKLTGDFPEIVLQQDVVNDYYDQIVAPFVEQMSGAEKNATMAEYVTILKAVPKSIKDTITNNLLSADPDLVAETADLINRIDEIAGLPELAVDANQRAFADILTGLMTTMEPEQAAKQALELTNPKDTARIEARKQQIKDDKMQEDYEAWVEDGFESFLGQNYLVDNINKQQVEAEFKDNFEAFFKAGMSKDRAKEKSIELLQRNWKESQFGFMKHPPEQFYAVGQNVDYIRDQLYTELKKNTIGLEFTKDNVYLQSDEQTSREAAQGRPSYRMIVIDNNGEFVAPILTDENGNQSNRWMPDPKAEKDRQMKEMEGKAKGIRKYYSETAEELPLSKINIGGF